jgi:hypothetical protein
MDEEASFADAFAPAPSEPTFSADDSEGVDPDAEGYSPYANASGGREPLGYSTIRGITLLPHGRDLRR